VRLAEHSGPVIDVAFSPDGTVRIWVLGLNDLIRIAKMGS
jgi:hypothetical protein